MPLLQMLLEIKPIKLCSLLLFILLCYPSFHSALLLPMLHGDQNNMPATPGEIKRGYKEDGEEEKKKSNMGAKISPDHRGNRHRKILWEYTRRVMNRGSKECVTGSMLLLTFILSVKFNWDKESVIKQNLHKNWQQHRVTSIFTTKQVYTLVPSFQFSVFL